VDVAGTPWHPLARTQDVDHSAVDLVQHVPLRVLAASPWTSLGCYQDPYSSLMYPYPLVTGPDVTVEACYLAAQRQGYPLFGLRSGNTCYGSSTEMVATISGSSDACSTPCSGNPYGMCGGTEVVEVYKIGKIGYSM
jgi:WSC domain